LGLDGVKTPPKLRFSLLKCDIIKCNIFHSLGGFMYKNLTFKQFIKSLYKHVVDDEVTALSAQLTYYLLLSFFPFLIFLITIVSYTPLAHEDILINLSTVLPNQTYNTVINIVNEIFSSRSSSVVSFGMIGTLWAASNGMKAIIRGINKAYNEEETRSYFIVRGIGVLFTIALVFGIIFSFITIVFGGILSQKLFEFLGISLDFQMLWQNLRYILSLVSLVFIFAFIYKYSPNCKITLKSVLPGAIFTTFGWIVISTLFSYYINNFDTFSKTYGSIGGIIALLIWLYISSIIILLGGEINALLSKKKNICHPDHTKK